MNRTFDFIVSAFGLIVFAPLILGVALLIKLTNPGPVFFIHQRIGRNFKPFRLYKFRTMTPDAPQRGPLITVRGDARVTVIGKILRKTKIDELPQLVNVFKGDMSLVGPRPEVEKYVKLFCDDYQQILTIRPGITDYAAIEFRHEEALLRKYHDPEEGYCKEVLPAKIKLYQKYLAQPTFPTNLRLIFLTLWSIISPRS